MIGTIGIVIPCYNQGRTVSETVESVLGQSRHWGEIVLVDDGSTDLYTRQLLQTAAWPGVRVVHTPNRGLPAARNHGIGLTTADYLVTLDADDVLEPAYLQETAAVLDADPAVAFVTTAIRGFGEASYVWTPPCDLISVLTRGGPHPATMFRRRVWQDVGGFDEISPIHGVEDLDFWISVLERGCRGHVLPEPLLRYRVTARSMHQRNVASGAHRRAMDALRSKHRPTVERLGIELLGAKEDALLDLWHGRGQLRARHDELDTRMRRLDDRLRAAREALRAVGREPIEWGDLRRLTPISPVWGTDRGLPLDRYYINTFLERHGADITGSVLEVKDPGYTRAFGRNVIRSEVLDIDASNPNATIVADLAHADNVRSDTFDCFVLTQTLQFIFDTRAALSHAYRLLKPGGVLLCTLPASGRINYEDEAIDGDYWRFTEASARRLFADVFPLENFVVDVQGNILANVAFLYGLTPDELRPDELNALDAYFPLVITIRAVKPGGAAGKGLTSGPFVARHEGDPPRGAILLYHRVASHPAADGTGVDARHFRAHMEYVREECRPMRLHELASAMVGGAVPARAVAVTVDDGGTDSLEVVSPIASELGIPVTFFLDTDRLDEKHERWWAVLARILLDGEEIPGLLSVGLQGEEREFRTVTNSERRAAFDALKGPLLTATLQERNRLIRYLAGWSTVDLTPRHAHRALTSPEILQLAATGHDIGAHSVNHLSLVNQSREVRVAEVADCKQALEALLNRRVDSFAYPYSRFDDECVSIVREAGFSSAVAVDPRAVAPGDDPFRLPRFEVGDTDRARFARSLETLLSM